MFVNYCCDFLKLYKRLRIELVNFNYLLFSQVIYLGERENKNRYIERPEKRKKKEARMHTFHFHSLYLYLDRFLT